MTPKVGVTYGMRGWFAVLYDADGPIQTGFSSFKTRAEAITDAIAWAKAENIDCDYRD